MRTNQCPKCGMDLPENRTDGLCPRCILQRLAADTHTQDFRFGNYELLAQIGRGGMGVVYKARHLKLGVTVALKRILCADAATPQELDRLRIEAETAANCRHPNIVAIHEFGEVNGEYYYTMDLIQGTNLAQKIRQRDFAIPHTRAQENKAQARQTQARIARLMSAVAHAVHHAHQCRFLHRDLTPSNILLDANDQPFITDFGVAKALSGTEDAVSGSHVVGKPSYMSPEQAAGKRFGFAADIYALGAILYELLTGHPPFRGTTPLDTLRLVTDQEVKNPSCYSKWVDQDLASICLKCLEKEPDRRYSSAQDLAEDLERWLQGRSVTARQPGFLGRTWRWVRRNPLGTALIATLSFGLIISFVVLEAARREREEKESAKNKLIRWIAHSIDMSSKSSQDSLLLPSEWLSAFAGKKALPGSARNRVVVGVFILRNPVERTIAFADVLYELERALAAKTGQTIRFDLRLYWNYQAAQADLLEGRVDLIRADPRLYLEAKTQTNNLALLMAESAQDFNLVIFTRRDTGITNLTGLAGRSLAFWDRHSSISLLGKLLLFEAHLNQTNLHCTYLKETPPFTNQQAQAALDPDGGYMDPQAAIVAKVKAGQFDAGLAIDRHLGIPSMESRIHSNYWTCLAAHQVPGCVWFARTNVGPEVLRGLQLVIPAVVKNPRLLLGRRMPGPPVAVDITTATERDLGTLSRALKIEGQFDAVADTSRNKISNTHEEVPANPRAK